MVCMPRYMWERNLSCLIAFLFKLASKYPTPRFMLYPEQSKRVIMINTKQEWVKTFLILIVLKTMKATHA